MRALTLVFLLPLLAAAQQPAPTGAVTGHVICDDTHLPARMASVVLQPVVDLNSSDLKPDSEAEPYTITTVIQTLLDGSFTISDVKPGNYYVIAEKIGYLSPLSQLSRQDLNHPTPTTAALMTTLLTPVAVVPNRTSTAEVHLLRGATISGAIRFDDGTPDSNAAISLLRKDNSGKWGRFSTKLLSTSFSSINTNDQGSFRITGLPAGAYLLKTSLEISDLQLNHIFSDSRSSAGNTRYSLDIYSGNAMRQRDAKSIKVAEGEDSDANDIEIPLTTLHAITGTVHEAATGRTVNAAHIEIHYTDDDTELVSTDVSKEDEAFHFLYVPEGEYTLKVTRARDVTRTEISNCSQCMPPSHTEEKTLRSFGIAEQPLLLHSDISGVTISVPPKPGSSTATPASPAQ